MFLRRKSLGVDCTLGHGCVCVVEKWNVLFLGKGIRWAEKGDLCLLLVNSRHAKTEQSNAKVFPVPVGLSNKAQLPLPCVTMGFEGGRVVFRGMRRERFACPPDLV